MEYEDGMEVEVFDHIELRRDGAVFEGQITKLHPRSREAMVRYTDHQDCRRDGEPKMKTARAHLSSISLVRRDG